MAQFIIQTGARIAVNWAINALQRQVAHWFADDTEGPRQADLQIQTSTEGSPIPIVYGRMRLAGQLIWAARFKETSVTRSSGGGKGGGPKTTEYSYSVSFAVGLCEGEIGGLGRIWADGSLLSLQDVTWRLHKGTEDQQPDPLIQAIEGQSNAPAYRGLAYVVFEDLPLEAFGNRIPNLSFEVIAPSLRDPGAVEQLINGVCLIPSSGEFAYADRAVMRELGEGEDKAENHHTTRATCDLEASLDDLQARLPHCGSVALVTSWFGDDLRAEQCTLTPRVESAVKQTHPLTWSVAGLEREQARLVSQDGENPVFGGTPSDETLIQAIKALKARGLEVTFYPFILMDVPANNALPDPYGAVEQAVFPWRGRITCYPAPGEPGSPDKTPSATAQINAFFGTAQASDFQIVGETITYTGPQEWGFNRFILHHAAIAKAAGGVESFIIGSEMRALTQVRDGVTSYPAVARLVALAAEVRSLLGPSVKLSYAADWSEYFGHTPDDGSGDRIFHLDPLWASSDIDFVGIDWYAPLSDWREGEAHLDRLSGAVTTYDSDYLASNVEGGEGYDWYYASSADREAQQRTPITDGAYAEPWVYRYKDLRNWWANAHHDRVGGTRQSAPTAWVPESKPVRLVELGCPAVDKGANQPNVFIDPKSSESTAPYHSSGARDDLIQRRYIEALLGYWQGDQNPISLQYGAPMLDLAHCHVWTWDARPFPEFPAREDVWSDGGNWRRGHWLTGRVGQSLVSEIVTDLAERAGLENLETVGVDGVLAGYSIIGGSRARDEIERLGAVFGFSIVDRAKGPACLSEVASGSPVELSATSLALTERSAKYSFSREPDDLLPEQVRIQFSADDGDYRLASASALAIDAANLNPFDLRLPALSDRDIAAGWAQDVLVRMRAQSESVEFVLPPSQLGLEAGDIFALDVGPTGKGWRLVASDGAAARDCTAQSTHSSRLTSAGPEPVLNTGPSIASRPLLVVLDFPRLPGSQAPSGFWAVAHALPWPGGMTLYAGIDIESAIERTRITAPGFLGSLTAPLGPGPEGRWDHANLLQIKLLAGSVSSLTDQQVLNGGNRLAVETSEGWEVLAFTDAKLQADGSWILTRLLRGLGGTPSLGAQEGARVVILDEAGASLEVSEFERDIELTILAVPPGKATNDTSVRQLSAIYTGVEERPLSPVHLRVRPIGDALSFSWVRRARQGGDAWGYGDVPMDETREAYQVTLLDGEDIVSVQEVAEASFTLTASDSATFFPAGLANAKIDVAQISDSFGPGRSARLGLEGTH